MILIVFIIPLLLVVAPIAIILGPLLKKREEAERYKLYYVGKKVLYNDKVYLVAECSFTRQKITIQNSKETIKDLNLNMVKFINSYEKQRQESQIKRVELEKRWKEIEEKSKQILAEEEASKASKNIYQPKGTAYRIDARTGVLITRSEEK